MMQRTAAIKAAYFLFTREICVDFKEFFLRQQSGTPLETEDPLARSNWPRSRSNDGLIGNDAAPRRRRKAPHRLRLFCWLKLGRAGRAKATFERRRRHT